MTGHPVPAGEPLGTRPDRPHSPDGWDQAGRGQSMRLDDWTGELHRRVTNVLADLEHVRATGATSHHDACWDEHTACLAARIRRTLLGADRGGVVIRDLGGIIAVLALIALVLWLAAGGGAS